MLALEVLAELPPVDTRPLLIRRPVLAPSEVQLLSVDIARGYNRVRVGVRGVPVDGVQDDSFREDLGLMLGDHLLDLLVAHLPVEGISETVVRPALLPALPLLTAGLHQLVLLALPHEFGQVFAPLFVAHLRALPVGVLGDVLRPDPLHLAPRRDEPRVVKRAATG